MTRLHNHNKTWDTGMLHELVTRFYDGQTLKNIAMAMGRTGTSICCKLKSAGLLEPDQRGAYLRKSDGKVWASPSHIGEVDAFMHKPPLSDNPCAEVPLGPMMPGVVITADTLTITAGQEIHRFINQKEEPMSTVQIDNSKAVSKVVITTGDNKTEKTFIYGAPAEGVTDDQIFGYISNLEVQIESLDKIKNKPKKLQAKIDALTADIDALVALVDAR